MLDIPKEEMKLYPKHIYDPVRVGVATMMMQKEMRKLFPSISQNRWHALDEDIGNWINGRKNELAPIHDFWNGFEGICQGFKLKALLRFITAQNIRWIKKDVEVSRIPLGWALPVIKEQAPQLGQPPYSSDKIIELLKDPKIYREFKKNSDYHSRVTVPRDHYPIILWRNQTKHKLLDGNRRVLRAIIYKKSTISAWVGIGPQPTNYWVSTPFMRNLAYLASVDGEQIDHRTYPDVKNAFRRIFEVSDVAKINFRLRVMDNVPAATKIGLELGIK
jgi:hypothetical protein